MKIQIKDLNGRSAFDLCRREIPSGRDPDESLEVYRGDTLAYTISSIKWGARHKVIENDKVGLYVGKWHPMTQKDKERLDARRVAKKSRNSSDSVI